MLGQMAENVKLKLNQNVDSGDSIDLTGLAWLSYENHMKNRIRQGDRIPGLPTYPS